MPKPRYRNPEAEREAEFEAILAARESFEEGFRRTNRGNLTRQWEGRTLTIFRSRKSKRFVWCIADGSEPRFSPQGYPNEPEALGALGYELNVWL